MARRWLVAVALNFGLMMGPTASAQETARTEPTADSEQSARTEGLRDEQRAYLGKNVRVHRTDGTTTTGRLIGETAEGLAIQPSASDEPVLVPYDDVESIATGMPRRQKIAIAIAAASVVIVAAALN
jgi:hypothetical protein